MVLLLTEALIKCQRPLCSKPSLFLSILLIGIKCQKVPTLERGKHIGTYDEWLNIIVPNKGLLSVLPRARQFSTLIALATTSDRRFNQFKTKRSLALELVPFRLLHILVAFLPVLGSQACVRQAKLSFSFLSRLDVSVKVRFKLTYVTVVEVFEHFSAGPKPRIINPGRLVARSASSVKICQTLNQNSNQV